MGLKTYRRHVLVEMSAAEAMCDNTWPLSVGVNNA